MESDETEETGKRQHIYPKVIIADKGRRHQQDQPPPPSASSDMELGNMQSDSHRSHHQHHQTWSLVTCSLTHLPETDEPNYEVEWQGMPDLWAKLQSYGTNLKSARCLRGPCAPTFQQRLEWMNNVSEALRPLYIATLTPRRQLI
jgi:hypothetical protein